ncbi:hypothetical protein [Solilutibacter tolerans]|uniref:Uncharacterized protein n=1 Tax=Solilutibacter tolerans TaxID=1604334 RepID=A0A1N6YM75_9GAMM|nr:hypothetical protein [Lysobacter tolerans]SIR15662.1 hypothetical protein SAMN05421546_0015 [Lysobacter tolerans]
MKVALQKLLIILALTVFAGISAGNLIGGLATGVINGPSRGQDAIAFASHPIGFSLMALLYLVMAVGAAGYAYHMAKHKPAA